VAERWQESLSSAGRRVVKGAAVVVVLASSNALADPPLEAAPSVRWGGNSGPTNSIGGRPPSQTETALPPSPATGQRGVQLRTNVLGGKHLQAGPTIDLRPNEPHPEVPVVATHGDDSTPVELGGFVGYLFRDDATGLPTGSLGLDLQVATDPKASAGGWLVQPGVDYSTVLAPSWQFSTRLFSTYSPDGSGTSGLGLDRPTSLRSGGSSEPGFQDVGVGLGLGYSITDNWNIRTQARYQRMLGAAEPDKQNETSPNQFFGGVMIDYNF
jgi:hypothetical protein